MTDLEVPEGAPEPKFGETDLVVYHYGNALEPHFCFLSDPKWIGEGWCYWATYVQSPAAGRPSGGAGGWDKETQYHLPETFHEQLLAMQYRARAKALAAAETLKEARTEAEAVDVTVGVFLAHAAETPSRE
jgi:hypothetical protein